MYHTCPRRSDWLGVKPTEAYKDFYREDDTCSYCGSLNPGIFMNRLEAGTVKLGATDKGYKVYIENDGGESFRQTYRDCPRDKEVTGAAGNKYMTSSCEGPITCTHWVTHETNSTKFYFQHLDEQQQERFIIMFNEKKIEFQGGIGFYVLPFFCSIKPKDVD